MRRRRSRRSWKSAHPTLPEQNKPSRSDDQSVAIKKVKQS
jgi:hypothetical protein